MYEEFRGDRKNNENHFKPLKIRQFMWMSGNKVFKAILCEEAGTLYVYDEDGKMVLKRIGIKTKHMNRIKKQLDDSMKKNINPMYIL